MANIVETAVRAGSFKTLVTAVQAAGLAQTLSSPGPFTVFAPTDEAFARLPAGTVENLLKDKAALTRVLTYHVVAGRHSAAEVIAKRSLQTVQGQNIRIDARQGVKINDATVIAPDVQADNGIIHVIDRVILPQ